MSVHSLFDGVALASSVLAETGSGPTASFGALAAVGAFLAVFLHKPLDSLSILTVMQAGGWSESWKRAVNYGFAAMCPLGVALFLVGVQFSAGRLPWVLSGSLAFSAGVFLCVALADLLPELRFHSHDRLKLSAMLLLGVFCAFAVGWLEPEHAHHGHGHGHSHESHEEEPD